MDEAEWLRIQIERLEKSIEEYYRKLSWETTPEVRELYEANLRDERRMLADYQAKLREIESRRK